MNLRPGLAIKICGITNEADALAAVAAGADILGFNTWRGTPRNLDVAAAAEWLAPLPVIKVALAVNATAAELRALAALPFIDAIQLHGDEDAAQCAAVAALGKPLIKAIRATRSGELENAASFSTTHVLLDANVPGQYGGTGVAADWPLAAEFRAANPALTVWLAGGLNSSNVADAVRIVRPHVVDVSSGVETPGEPRRKSAEKMRAFVAAARTPMP